MIGEDELESVEKETYVRWGSMNMRIHGTIDINRPFVIVHYSTLQPVTVSFTWKWRLFLFAFIFIPISPTLLYFNVSSNTSLLGAQAFHEYFDGKNIFLIQNQFEVNDNIASIFNTFNNVQNCSNK